MKFYQLDEMIKGWFVGNFTPTAYWSKDVEVAVKHYAAGDYESLHLHKIATEITVVVSGTVNMNKIEYTTGQVIVIEPGETTDFQAITKATTVVVKFPSLIGDKYLGDTLC